MKGSSLLVVLIFALLFLILASCDSSDNEAAIDDDDIADDDVTDDDAAADGDDDDDLMRDKLENLFEEMGFRPYLDFKPYRTEEDESGYTRYFYSTDDFKCYGGTEANVAVSMGTSNNVVFYLEAGGASWPGFHLAYEVDFPGYEDYLSPAEENPLRDWNIVYVPYCDNSLHIGDSEVEEEGSTVYHHGLRHSAAAAALMKELFPDPDKILVLGVSAGGF